jgi:hypothetical protein
MTIRPGEPWGEPAVRPADLVVASSDAELAALVAAGHREVGVSNGDLHRSLGAPPMRADVQRLPLDALRVVVDGRELLAVAHVVAARSWWRGRVVFVMNTEHLGERDVAPRAHPNDGRFDVVEIDPGMPLRARWEARRRMPHGTHLPHPSISLRRATDALWSFERPTPVRVDGVAVGAARRLEVTIEPDRYELLA